MFERIGDHLDYYVIPNGGRNYALQQLLTLGPIVSRDHLRVRVEDALDVTTREADMMYDWRQQKKLDVMRREGAQEIDAEVDTTLSGLRSMAEAQAALRDGAPQKQLAGELIEELFPQGVYPITSLKYEAQHTAVDRLLERLDGPFSTHVDKLGMRAMVDQLRQLNDEYGARLNTLDNEGVSWSGVLELRQQAQDDFHRVIIAILAEFMDDEDTLEEVMQPIFVQNERVRRYYKERGKSPAIDPETGQPIDEDVTVDV